MSRKTMSEQRRSMNGTRGISRSSDFFPRAPPLFGTDTPAIGFPLDLQLVAVRDDQVEDGNGRLVDVVDEVLGLAVDRREGEQAEDRGEEAERGAVHGLRDAFREDLRLEGGVDAGLRDRREALHQTEDRAEEAGEHRDVREHCEVSGARLE